MKKFIQLWKYGISIGRDWIIQMIAYNSFYWSSVFSSARYTKCVRVLLILGWSLSKRIFSIVDINMRTIMCDIFPCSLSFFLLPFVPTHDIRSAIFCVIQLLVLAILCFHNRFGCCATLLLYVCVAQNSRHIPFPVWVNRFSPTTLTIHFRWYFPNLCE